MLRKIDEYILSFGQDTNKLAQIGHFLAGVVAASWFGLIGCGAFTVGWVVPKEVLLDPGPPEHAPFFWSGAKDMGFYLLGQAVGLAHKYLVR